MRILIAIALLLSACDDKPKLQMPEPPKLTLPTIGKIPPPKPLVPPVPSFKTDRLLACASFAGRVAPSMKSGAPPEDAVAEQCRKDGRITKANFPCLMSAKSGDELEACFKGTGKPSPPFGQDKGIAAAESHLACSEYAKHVLELMSADLKQTMTEMCMSPKMTEAIYDCVMNAKSDDEFKRCLGAPR